MFDLGWTELLVIGIVALIVVGPKDLPGMFQAIGRFTGKAKAMARDFSRAMNDAANESGVNDISKTMRAAANPAKFGTDAVKSAMKPGGETEKLSKERAEAKDKILAASAKAAEERIAREKAEAEAAAAQTEAPAPEPETSDAPAEDDKP